MASWTRKYLPAAAASSRGYVWAQPGRARARPAATLARDRQYAIPPPFAKFLSERPRAGREFTDAGGPGQRRLRGGTGRPDAVSFCVPPDLSRIIGPSRLVNPGGPILMTAALA